MDDRQIALEARFDTILPTLATKADVESLRADIHKGMLGSMVALFVGFGGLAAAMGQLLKPPSSTAPVVLQSQPQAQPTQPPTIIINVPQQK